MLNNISWASYFYAVTIFLLIYYAFVLIVYYRNDLQNHLQKFTTRSNSSSLSHNLPANRDAGEIINDWQDQADQNNSIGQLFLSLQSLIKNGANRNFPKEELLLSLQLKLQHYSALKDNSLKDNINNFIISECKNYCSIHLNGDEVSALWIK
ncbi:MAG: hypothetical protein H7Z13_02110 [Ferruginibacter sp.]|nr:hypothetical protein [Ferruginibacter sp.]